MSRPDSDVFRLAWTQPAPDPEAAAQFLHVLEEAAHVRARALGLTLKPVGVEQSLFGKVRSKAVRRRDVQEAEVLVLVAGHAWDAEAGAACLAAYQHARDVGTPVWFFAQPIEEARLYAPDAATASLLDLRDRIEQDGHAVVVEYEEPAAWTEPLLQRIVFHLDGLKPEETTPAFDAGDLDAGLGLVLARDGTAPLVDAEADLLAKRIGITEIDPHHVRRLIDPGDAAVRPRFLFLLVNDGDAAFDQRPLVLGGLAAFRRRSRD